MWRTSERDDTSEQILDRVNENRGFCKCRESLQRERSFVARRKSESVLFFPVYFQQ